jgi:hypothetical protein
MIKINPWLGSELAFVADSGLWIGYRFALVAGNRYKAELRTLPFSTARKMPWFR